MVGDSPRGKCSKKYVHFHPREEKRDKIGTVKLSSVYFVIRKCLTSDDLLVNVVVCFSLRMLPFKYRMYH